MASKFDISSTAAYKIINEILRHSFGDPDWDDEDTVCTYKLFIKSGGLWENLINGEPRQIEKLQNSISSYLDGKKLLKIATRIVNI